MFSFYVYCLTAGLSNKNIVMRNSTIAGENYIKTVNYNDIQAAVSIVDSELFNENAVKENLKDLGWVKEKAVIHENIIEEIMESLPVLPMRFCTVFSNIEDLTGFLKKYYTQIKDFLQIAAKSCEWGIKIFCDKSGFKKNITETEDIKAEIKEISQKSKGVAFMLMKRFEEKLDNYFIEVINRDVQYFFEQLKIIAEDTIVREIQNECPEKNKIVLDMVCLVNNRDCQCFRDKVSNIVNEYGCESYTIECTGPWPIYNFVFFDKGVDLKHE